MRIFNLSAVIALSAVSFLSAGVTLTPNVRAGVNFSNLIGGDRKDPKVLDGFDISFKNGFVGGAVLMFHLVIHSLLNRVFFSRQKDSLVL